MYTHTYIYVYTHTGSVSKLECLFFTLALYYCQPSFCSSVHIRADDPQ